MLAGAFTAFGGDENWRTMIGKAGDLVGETGIMAFASKEAPSYITGNTLAADRAAKPDLSKPRTGDNTGANRNGYWDKDGKWVGGYFDDTGAFVKGHEVKMLFGMPYGFGQLIMIPVCLVLMYLAIVKGFEPLLLLPIGFGGLLANCPLSGITTPAMMHDGLISFLSSGIPQMSGGIVEPGGFLYYFFKFGIDSGVFPIMIFMGVGYRIVR